MSNEAYEYDIAISFAGEDRAYAEALADVLCNRGIHVFYDKYEKAVLWGRDLYSHLSDLYQNRARYCVIFISQQYAAKVWTKHELKAAQARALNEKKEYILPIRLDNTEIPGILPTIAYLDWHQETAESVAIIICEKLGKIALLTKEQCRTEAIICMMKKDFEGALAFYKHASHLDPVDPQLYVDQSAMLDRLDRQEESLAACEQAIRLDPDCADAYYNKGDALIALGRFEEAIAACERAIHLNPNHPSSYVNKGVALSHLGRSEEALATYESVLQMNPKYALAYYNKAAVLDRLGRTMEAQLARRKAKQYGYFNRKKEAVEVAPSSLKVIEFIMRQSLDSSATKTFSQSEGHTLD